jgi:hypothetical protein
LYLGNLRLSTVSLAIEIRKPLDFAVSYVFIFGNFDGLSKLVTILPIPYGNAHDSMANAMNARFGLL